MFICRFCNQERKNSNSLRNHERLCKVNPERQLTHFHNLEFQKNKDGMGNGVNHYTKAKRLGLEKPIVSEDTRKKLSDNLLQRTPEWNAENGIRISKAINAKVEAGEWHTSLAKNMHFDYNGIDLHGSWEVKYAMYLDKHCIKWIRNKDSFCYFYDGKERRYTPDFYLVDSNEYIEIKGYETEKDRAKWSQFPVDKKLIILKANDLKIIEVI